jgi:predicted nucleic acid-binding protein
VIVVDTNILVYRWLPGLRGGQTEALLRLDAEWAAPLLWRSEMRNVLTAYIRLGKLTPARAETAMHHAAASLLGGEHAVADSSIFELVDRSKCTSYECEFAALAKALHVPLITEDKALLAAFPQLCRSLGQALRHGLGAQGPRGAFRRHCPQFLFD